MKSKSVKNSLTLMCLMIVLVSVIVIGGISISNISTMTSTANKNYENARLDGYNTEIKSQVQSVIAILQAEYDKSQNGDLTEDEAKKEAAEIVRNMRYRDDGSGYFWIDDTDYNLIMHPILTDQEGINRYDLTDQNGVKRRAGAGMGRCQGGFCGPRVLELISRELGIDPLDILQDKNGSNVLLSETKVGGKSNG